MKLEDQLNQDELVAKSWIERHPGAVLWIGLGAIFVIAFIALAYL